MSAILVLWLSGCSLHHQMSSHTPCSTTQDLGEWKWFGPSDPEEKEVLEEWCDMVGPSLVKPIPAAGFEPLENLDSLAVFSWNVDVGSGDLLTFMQEEVGLTCELEASAFDPGLRHAVILVQEAFRWAPDLPPLNEGRLGARKSRHDPHPGGDLDIAEVADRCGLALVYTPSGRNGVDDPGEKLRDKGNAILSTLPLSNPEAIVLPFETERKVAVGATLPLGVGDSLRVVNGHLEVTTNFLRVLLTGNQTRLRQVEGLIEALDHADEEAGRDLPTLLGGDFNTWSGRESALKRLWLAFPDSPDWDGETSMGPFPTDHLFFRRGGDGVPTAEDTGAVGGTVALVPESYRLIEKKYSSDHRGRFVWIRVGNRPEVTPLRPPPYMGLLQH